MRRLERVLLEGGLAPGRLARRLSADAERLDALREVDVPALTDPPVRRLRTPDPETLAGALLRGREGEGGRRLEAGEAAPEPGAGAAEARSGPAGRSAGSARIRRSPDVPGPGGAAGAKGVPVPYPAPEKGRLEAPGQPGGTKKSGRRQPASPVPEKAKAKRELRDQRGARLAAGRSGATRPPASPAPFAPPAVPGKDPAARGRAPRPTPPSPAPFAPPGVLPAAGGPDGGEAVGAAGRKAGRAAKKPGPPGKKPGAAGTKPAGAPPGAVAGTTKKRLPDMGKKKSRGPEERIAPDPDARMEELLSRLDAPRETSREAAAGELPGESPRAPAPSEPPPREEPGRAEGPLQRRRDVPPAAASPGGLRGLAALGEPLPESADGEASAGSEAPALRGVQGRGGVAPAPEGPPVLGERDRDDDLEERMLRILQDQARRHGVEVEAP